MNEKAKDKIQNLKSIIESDRLVKVAFYVGVGVLTLYLLGKTFKGLATTVRGFNDLKSAINGN